MSTALDPYQAWLNISPGGRPPNHYQLLGLNLYDDDDAAIRQGAERQLSLVATHAHKSDAATARRLSSEIAAARTCLLSPPDKARYDAQLRKRPLAAAPASAPVPPATLAPMMAVPAFPTDSTTDPQATGPTTTHSATAWMRLARVKQRLPVPVIVGGVLSVLAILIFAMILAARNAGPNEHAQGNSRDRAFDDSDTESKRTTGKSRDKVDPKPLEILALSAQTTAPGEPILVEPALAEREADAESVAFKLAKPAPRGAKIDSKTGRITWRPTSRHANRKQQFKIIAVSGSQRAERSVTILVEPNEAPPIIKKDPVPEKVVTQPPVEPDPPEPAPATEIVRVAVPDEAQLATARELATKVYGQRLAAATADEDRLAVAQTMVDGARDLATSGAERYVLLEQGIESMGSAGATVEGVVAIDVLGKQFDVDTIARKARLFDEVFAAHASKSASGSRQLSLAAIKMANEAAKDDRYEEAIAALRLANSASRRVADHDLSRAALKRRAELESLQDQFEPVKMARDALAKNPEDAGANLYAGRWTAFVQGDWEQGLPMLKKGSNELLKSIATDELADPQQPDAQAALADRWWDLSQKAKGAMRDQIQSHAAEWYKKAVPGLTGLSAQAAQQRIDEFDGAGGFDESEPGDDEIRE